MKIEKGFSVAPEKPKADGFTPAQDQKLRDAAKMYEQHFMNEMYKAMRSTVQQDDGLIKRNMAEKIFQLQLDSQYTEKWADRGGLGLQNIIYDQIKQQISARMGRPIEKPQGPLPVPTSQPLPANPDVKVKPLPADDKSAKYWMEANPLAKDALQVLSPWEGSVVSNEKLEDGWSNVKIDHGQGLSSVMTFQGQANALAQGDRVEPGQKLGKLNPERPVLAWKLDWS